ncbi:MAG TPA: hypothetical protein VG733_14450 [Chthoniobacteraceae bacterium]|nr:hypothetical protein [Chthoniobacteraceae bacterium]
MGGFLPLTDGRKLQLFQEHDPLKQWWSLDELRYCGKCEHLFIGREIKVTQDDDMVFHFRCPTFNCDADFADWQYPNLHL